MRKLESKDDLPEWTVLVEIAERLSGSLKRVGLRNDWHDRAAGHERHNPFPGIPFHGGRLR